MKRTLLAILFLACLLTAVLPACSTSSTPTVGVVETTPTAVVKAPTPAPSAAAPKPTVLVATPSATTTAAAAPTTIKGTGPAVLFMRGNDLWRVDVNNAASAGVLLTDARQVAVSPDQKRLAFVRGQGQKAEIWLANADGSQSRQLTNNDREDSVPAWSPDGKTLAFTSSSSALDSKIPWLWWGWSSAVNVDALAAWAPKAEVWLVNADGANPRKLAAGFGASWAPEGRRLAFHRREGDILAGTANAYILVINSEGKNEWKLAPSAPKEGQVSGGLFYGQLVWTPDGKDLIYGTSSYAMLSDWGLLHQAPTQSKATISTLGQTAGYFARIALSSDGQYLATDYYGSNGRGESDGLTVFQLGKPNSGTFFLDPMNYTATSVLQTPQAHSPAWSPDGRTLAYVANDGVWLWDRASQKATKLLENALAGTGLVWVK